MRRRAAALLNEKYGAEAVDKALAAKAELKDALRRYTRSHQTLVYELTWKLNDEKEHFEYLVIVAGKDAHRLDRFSVKKLGVKTEEDEEEQEDVEVTTHR